MAPRPTRLAAEDHRVAWWLFAAVACLFLLTSRGNMGSFDPGWRWFMAAGLLDGQDLRWPEGAPAVGPVFPWGLGHVLILAATDLAARGAEAVLHLPVAKDLLSQALACGVQALMGAGIAALVFLWARAAGYRAPAALGAALLTCCGTYLWKYTTDCFYEVPQGLLVAGAFVAALAALRPGVSASRSLVAAGCCFGGAWLIKATNVFLLPGLLAAWALPYLKAARAHGGIRAASLILPVAALALAFLPFWAAEGVFDRWRYGLWPVPLQVRYPNFHYPAWQGVPKLLLTCLVGPAWGLLWYSPLLVFAIGFAPRLVRRLGYYGWALLGTIALSYGLASLNVEATNAGLSWGVRFLVPVVPLFGLLLAEGAEWLQSAGRWWRAAAAVLVAASVGSAALSTASSHTRWYLGREVRSRSGQPGPPPQFLSQPGEAAELFANYTAGRRFRLRQAGDTPEHLYAECLTYNYPNYWWALPVGLGAPRWPFLAGAAALAAAAVLCLLRTLRALRFCRSP